MNNPIDELKAAGNSVKSTVTFITGFLAAMWICFGLSFVLPINRVFALDPNSWWGIVGVLTAPFLHGGLFHIIGNTIGIIIMSLFLSAGFTSRSSFDDKYGVESIYFGIIILSGLLYYFTGSNPVVGASGLVYGLAGMVIAVGISQKKPLPAIVAIAMVVFYGWNLLYGLIPGLAGQNVSWWGHICGAIAGVVMGFALKEEK
jgi:membrane associated rhomboid family serine protease